MHERFFAFNLTCVRHLSFLRSLQWNYIVQCLDLKANHRISVCVIKCIFTWKQLKLSDLVPGKDGIFFLRISKHREILEGQGCSIGFCEINFQNGILAESYLMPNWTKDIKCLCKKSSVLRCHDKIKEKFIGNISWIQMVSVFLW